MVRKVGAFRADDSREKELIDISRRKIRLEPVLRVLVGIIVDQACGFGDLVVFVVAGEDNEGGVVSEAANVEGCLLLDGFEEVRRAGVVAACEHEVLPD